MLEKALVHDVEAYLIEQGYQTVTEVPFLHRVVDIVALSEDSRSTIMVEAKVEKWRKALDQARTCLLGADEVYIAVPSEFAHRIEIGMLEEFGIGLLVVGDRVEVRLKPGRAFAKVDYHADGVVLAVKSRLGTLTQEDVANRG